MLHGVGIGGVKWDMSEVGGRVGLEVVAVESTTTGVDQVRTERGIMADAILSRKKGQEIVEAWMEGRMTQDQKNIEMHALYLLSRIRH